MKNWLLLIQSGRNWLHFRKRGMNPIIRLLVCFEPESDIHFQQRGNDQPLLLIKLPEIVQNM